MGICLRVAYWDEDERKDLLVGTTYGEVMIFLNLGSDTDPHFNGGSFLQVGPPGEKVDIYVGFNAAPILIDWNENGLRDLVVGAADGKVYLFLNEGSDTDPDYLVTAFAQENGGDLEVPWGNSSPAVLDLDEDGKKDLVTGNTEGQLFFYRNLGQNDAPFFSGYDQLTSQGVPINLYDLAHSRPCICDWTGDGFRDALLGSTDGMLHLFQGLDPIAVEQTPLPATCLLSPWPNPCNPHATIPFTLAAAAHVRLSIHDLSGRRVALLADGRYPAGLHELSWRARDERGASLPSGVYLLRLETGGGSETRKLVLLR